MKRLFPLTAEEQSFAEEQYGLVHAFLSCKGLSENEYFDIVIFGFLEAVQKQHRNPAPLERQNFHSFAFGCMKHALGEDAKYRRAKKRSVDPVSLDDAPGGLSLYRILSDDRQDPQRAAEAHNLLEQIWKAVSKREMMAAALQISGYDVQESAEKMGITRMTYKTTLYHFRRKAKYVRAGWSNPL